MQLTSKSANKLLKQLNESLEYLYQNEERSSSYVVPSGEDEESIRPEYDFIDYQNNKKSIISKIIKLKHALNIFNSTTLVEGTGKTIDELLIYLPYLNRQKTILTTMQNKLPKSRSYAFNDNGVVDYCYLNYKISDVTNALTKVCNEITDLQIALDTVNVINTFEVEL